MKPLLLQKQLERLATDRWARQGVRTLLRTTSLGLSIWSLGLGGHLLFGWPLDFTLLQALVLGCIALGALALLRPRMKPHDVARRLDRRFELKEQISTAIEVGADVRPEGVAGHLLGRARHNTYQIQRDTLLRQRLPWPEIIMLVAMVLMAMGMLLMTSLSTSEEFNQNPLVIPPLAGPDALPENQFPPEPFAAPQAAGQPASEEGQRGNAAASAANSQQAMNALADALRDLSITRPAAEALDQGNTAAAAQSIRELADQAEQLSQETRRELSQALQQAADETGAQSPEFSNQLRESASQLGMGARPAARALDDLANAIEQLGEQAPPIAQEEEQQGEEGQPQQPPGPAQQPGQPGGSPAGGQGDMANPPPSEQRELPAPPERLGVDGVPLELEGGDEANAPTEGDEEQSETADGMGGGAFEHRSGSAPDDLRGSAGADPLRIPADLQDVVKEYFSPSE